jgi:ketosteroid isomerase-like protein
MPDEPTSPDDLVAVTNMQLVERLLDAFNERDIGRFAELTTPDFEWSPSMVAIEGEVFLGREGIETYFGRMIDAWDEFRVVSRELRDLGDRVLVLGRLEGRGRVSGVPVSAALDVLYDIRGGKISRMRSFLDHNDALHAAGLEE